MDYHLLWAFGQDRPGIVTGVTKRLYELRCNLEDSSMMRLGSEFALFVIFTSPKPLPKSPFVALEKSKGLTLGVKKISSAQARFTPVKKETYFVRVHGQDQAGLVFHVTDKLNRHRFNITDLSTHRTTQGKRPGYILLIEGELPKGQAKPLMKDLKDLATKLQTHISCEPVSAAAI